jgi:hypothetical protein
MVALLSAAGAPAAGAALPDGRGYELVSPPDKNGVQVIPQTNKAHVRPDGNAVTFSSLGGFSSVEGSSVDFEYLSERTGVPGTSGWSTHGINPLARPVTFGAAVDENTSSFVNGFTSDLSAGIYLTWRPLVDAPNVADVSNLYRITGLADGPRAIQLMSDAVTPLPDSWFTFMDNRGIFVRRIVPRFAGISSDLRHVVFESSLNLTADAPPYPAGLCALVGGFCPTKLYENVDGVVRLVGRVPDGTDACDDAAGPTCVAAESSQTALGATARRYSQLAISRDGRRILFQVPANAETGAIYLREDGVRTEQIAADGEFWTASADGARAFFITSASLAGDEDRDGIPDDADTSPDLYMYDREAPAGSELTLVSAGSPGLDGIVNAVVAASDDGRTVYFICNGQLIAGEPGAFMGFYRWHEGQLSFIGDFPTAGIGAANGSRAKWGATSTATRSRITPDARHVLFMNTDAAGFVGRGGFSGYDHADHEEFYVYDSESGRLACASCNPTGRAATTNAFIDVRDAATASVNTSDSARALTDDGRRVFFNTAEALVPEDLNGRSDAYEYDTQAGTVQLLSSGRSTSPSYFIDASPNGDDVFIVTRERLVGWDVDDSYDLYDARVGGGFPEPPATAPACAGEGCRGQGGSAPAADGIASLGSGGAGDAAGRLTRHRRCKARKVLRKVRGTRRCVRQRSHRPARRAAARDERSGR